MFHNPESTLSQNTLEYESKPLVKPTGFREYDARWLFGEEINLMGIQALGMGLGTLVHELGVRPEIVVAHDFRSYSASIKMALINGLMATGMKIHDIGLAITPMAYFAQFDLDVPAVAMVTASHNENGWTGVKMGVDRPLTFGPDEMTRLKDIVLGSAFNLKSESGYVYVSNFFERYLKSLTDNKNLENPIKVVVACGNGTAGAFAPKVLNGIGAEVIPLDCELDFTFPRYNPNPEDLEMLNALREKVIETGANLGLGFDGDGDRCGVVDNEGEKVFADKVGVLLARELSKHYPNSKFIVDVKSTGLFGTDSELKKNNAEVEYYKTGHSYMKRRTIETGAIAGFEKSGHYFFNAPVGHGYDDGLVSAIAILDMLDRNSGKSMADIRRELPKTWGSPTMSPSCADEVKYQIIDKIVARFQKMKSECVSIDGLSIVNLNTVNGVRIECEDGTWGLVRASSNKPELVVVVESPKSEERMRGMFDAIDSILREFSEIGEYNQTF